MRHSTLRRALRGAALLAALAPLPLHPVALAAQLPAIQFHGTFQIGSVPAPVGAEVRVLAVRSARDMTLCGSSAVQADGSYRIAVPRTAACARQGNGGPVHFVFAYAGEKVGSVTLDIDLNNPDALGREFEFNLSASDNPARPQQGGPALVPLRFHGRFEIAGRAAPAGTWIELYAGAQGGSPCGTTTVGAGGYYSLDLLASAACMSVGADDPVSFTFVSGGRRVGGIRLPVDPRSRDLPGSTFALNLSASRAN
jgi:hypothetical protein